MSVKFHVRRFSQLNLEHQCTQPGVDASGGTFNSLMVHVELDDLMPLFGTPWYSIPDGIHR